METGERGEMHELELMARHPCLVRSGKLCKDTKGLVLEGFSLPLQLFLGEDNF